MFASTSALFMTPAPPLPSWLAEMLPAGSRRTLVDVGDGVRMCVTELGGEGRPIVLVHGNPTWSFLYRQVAEKLTGDGLRLIMPDLVGLGFSDTPRDPRAHTLDQHGRWLATLLDHLGLGPLILVVQDWGGAIGMLGMADRARSWLAWSSLTPP